MTKSEQQRFDRLYKRHLTALKLQGKSKKTIDMYGRALRRVAEYFDRCPDTLTVENLKDFFSDLVDTHSWSTVKVDRNGLQFFWKHVLEKQWDWVFIAKPPVVKRLPDILTIGETRGLLQTVRLLRYRVFLLTVYSMGLRLGEALHLKISDIDAERQCVHIRQGKGCKDRFVYLPEVTLLALRAYWATHRNPTLLFPSLKSSATTVGVMDRGGAQQAMKAVVKERGIHKRISIHSLRHCYATHLLEIGLNLRSIQTLLGHENPTTTAIYTQLTHTTHQNAHILIHTLMKDLVISLIKED